MERNNPNLMAKYDATIDTANMAPDAEHVIEYVLEEYESEDADADMKTVEDRVSYSGTVDKAEGCRNVSCILKREIKVILGKPPLGGKVSRILSGTGERQVDKTYPGHVDLDNGASDDEGEKRQSKEQESRRTGSVTELFEEQFSAMGKYFTELLGDGGKAN
jgi:phage terminase Nu1 subunit (DNA packaging protein)